MMSMAPSSARLLASFRGGNSTPMAGPAWPTWEVVKKTGSMSSSRKSFSACMRSISTEPTMPRQPTKPTFFTLETSHNHLKNKNFTGSRETGTTASPPPADPYRPSLDGIEHPRLGGAVAGLEGADLVRFLEGQADLVQPLQQALLAEGVDLEGNDLAAGLGDGLGRQVDGQLIARARRHVAEQAIHNGFIKNDWQHTVFEAVVVENIGKARGDDGANAKIVEGPGGVLAARTAAKILPRQEDRGALVTLLVEGKIRVQGTGAAVLAVPALIQVAHLVEQIGAKARALDGLQKLLGDDHVGVDIGQVHGTDEALVGYECFHGVVLRPLCSRQLAHVDDMAGDGGRRGRGRAHQVGAATGALAPFEVAVGGGCAVLAPAQNVGVHRQAHGAAGFPPVHAGLDEDLVETFLLRLHLDQMGTGHHVDLLDAVRHLAALGDGRRGAQILDPRIGAGTDEDLVDPDVGDR